MRCAGQAIEASEYAFCSAMLSSGGLTRLVDPLESRGLVRRAPNANDARSFQASLTSAGAAALAAARRTHDAVIAALLGSRLSATDGARVTDLLRQTLEE